MFPVTWLLPLGLGLLGFVEPCTIGGHLLFLDSQSGRSAGARVRALGAFVAVRALVMGLFGALVAWAGAAMIGVQTGLWLVLGAIYLLIGLALLAGRAGPVGRRIRLGPAAWRRARSPVLLGAAFGLSIPACAAPILFALTGPAAAGGAAGAGFRLMALFGLALSAPLAVLVVAPGLTGRLERLGARLKRNGRVPGGVFVVLGLWSLWFGLFVDPAGWAGP